MNSSNYLPNNNGNGSDLLDRVLRDLTPEQRVRVLDLTLRLDIHKDDPLWLIALAIGQLQILLQDSPQDLRLLFDNVQMELEEWAEATTTVLEATLQDAKNTEVLAHGLENLLSVLATLSKLLTELATSLNQHGSQNVSSSLSMEFGHLRQEFATLLQTNSTSLRDSITSQVSNQVGGILRHHSNTTSNTSDKRLLWVSLGANALLLMGVFSLWRTHAQTSQRIQWMWQHQQKIECAVGVMPKNSKQCKALL
ncbi:MAG: hypothetical protein KME46_21795 [Brasilonema angustatum HA4187-MV1]|jgi:hypothetical protein|nr:hypothetical protein [Brasilonema angustatum HA4187-MV1]